MLAYLEHELIIECELIYMQLLSFCSAVRIYVDSGNGSVRVLEIECGTLEEGSAPESVDEQLKQFEERFVLHICSNQSFEGGLFTSLPLSLRLQVVSQLQSSTQAQLSSIDERIGNIEQQLSALESMLLARSRS